MPLGAVSGLSDDERVEDAQSLLVRALEPALVTDLDLHACTTFQRFPSDGGVYETLATSDTTGSRGKSILGMYLADVELAVSAHRGGHKLVAATFVSVCGADEQLVLVVVLALVILLLGHVQQGARCIPAVCKPSLGPR